MGKGFFAFNILIEDEECLKESLSKNELAKIGKRVARLAEITGGFNISLCEADYGPSLQNISKAIEIFVEAECGY